MQHFEVPTEQIIAWRHHFHENPELSFKEFKTSQFMLIAAQKMIKTVNTLSNALPKLPKTLLRLMVQLLK